MKRTILIVFGLLCLYPLGRLQAQEKNSTDSNLNRWYVGGDVGITFGSATFKSIAADKTRTGFGLGLLGGYHLNSFLSAEAELRYTHLGLGAYDCCQHLWLGSDGNRYLAPVAGMQGWNYQDVYSSMNLFGLGLHLNVDFLKLFRPDSRWSALLSPAIYGTGSWAKVKIIADKADAYDTSAFHFGIGTDIGVGYQVCDQVNVRLYTGITYLTGNGMDGLQQTDHTSNYTWNTGVKITMGLDKLISKVRPILTRNKHE